MTTRRIKTYNVQNGSSRSCDECDRPGCQALHNGVQCGETNTLHIINKFKQVYEDKMRVIDEEGSGDCSIQAKISLQHDWIRDLTEQNEMLVRAVEALEQEATERVFSLEEKLKHSSKSAYEVMNGYKNISINLEETFQRIGHMQNDLQNLIELIRRGREDGSWNMDDLEFYTITKADIIGSEDDNQIATNSLKYADEKVMRKFKLAVEIVEDVENVYVNKEEEFYVKPYIDDNNAETLEFAYKNAELLKERDKKIEELEAKLQNSCNFNEEMTSARKAADNYSSLQQSMLDMRDALTAEVADKHDTIVSLRREVQLLEEQCRKADQQTHFKDDIIKELRKEIKQLKQEGCPELKSKALQMEQENDDLRRAITKATQHLEMLEDKTEEYMSEKFMLQQNCADNCEKISCLECERDDLLKQLECVQMDCCKLNEENMNNASCFNKLKEESGFTISSLHEELNTIKHELMQSQNQVSELCAQNKEHFCTIQSLQQSRQQAKLSSVTVGIEPILIEKHSKAQNIPSSITAKNSHRMRRSPQKNEVSWDTEYYSDSSEYCDVNILKSPNSNFSRRSCSRDSSPSSSRQDRTVIKSEAKSLEGAIHGLKDSVSRMMLSECKNNETRKRIADLEEQVQKNSRKDEMIDIQNDTLNIVENELQAWRFKDSEIEKARLSRDLEIKNMKETIAMLLNNLQNEKIRSENLQKAVDLYLNSINVLQETEEQFKKEISDQRLTIQNLQEALVVTKQSLEEYQNKSNQDVGLGWATRWFGASNDPSKSNSTNKPVHDV